MYPSPRCPVCVELEKAFLAQVSERSKHRVLVDFRNRCDRILVLQPFRVECQWYLR